MTIKFLGPDGEDSFEQGDTIRIESTIESEPEFSDTKTKEDVATATVTITDYNDNKVVDSQSMTNHDTGEYFFNWDTTSESTGDYKVQIDVAENNIEGKDIEWIRLN